MALDPQRAPSSLDKPSSHQGRIHPETLKAALELWSQSGEAHYIPITGRSMLPLLRNGDHVLVVHSREVSVGDIVVFQRTDGLIAHRVLRIEGDEGGSRTLFTKGDNVLTLDPPIQEAELVGSVVAIRRGHRHLDLDSPAWHWIGRGISRIMRVQAAIYPGARQAPRSGLPMVNHYLARFFSQLLLRIAGISTRFYLAVFGRWQELEKR